jgi:hypothetical protein
MSVQVLHLTKSDKGKAGESRRRKAIGSKTTSGGHDCQVAEDAQ